MPSTYTIEYSALFRKHSHTTHFTTDDPVAAEEFVEELLERGFAIRAIKHDGQDLPPRQFDRVIRTAAELLASQRICASLGIKADEEQNRFGFSAAFRRTVASGHALSPRSDLSALQTARKGSKDDAAATKAMATAIAEHPFLRGLKPEHLRFLADSAMYMRYEPGDIIFHESEPANRFYLIEQGHVSLEFDRQDEPPAPIQIIGPGDVLGWSWLFPPYHWHFDARALEPVTAIFFYGTRLREQCEMDHLLGYELMKRVAQVLINRLQATRKELLKAIR